MKMLRIFIPTAVLFVALAAVFFMQSPTEARERPWRGPHVTEDGWYYYHWLRSAVIDGDLDLENDYREVGNWYGFGWTKTGRRHNPFGVGPAIAWTPGFLVGHAVSKVAGNPSSPPGMSRAEQGGALFTSFLASLGAFWLALTSCRRWTSDALAWTGTALAFLATPMVWYAIFSPAMPHALEAFFGAAFVWELLPLRERTWKESLRLGAIAGGMILCRPQLVLFLAVPLFELVQILVRTRSRTMLLHFGILLAVVIAIFSPQLVVWKLTYGSWIVVPQGSGFLRFGESMWSETLFSSRNGLFTTTPILWLLVPGFVVLVRRDRTSGLVLLALFAMQTFVNGAAWDWWGGGAFGGRRFLATFPIWAITFSVSLDAIVRHRVAIVLAGMASTFFVVLQWRMLVAHYHHRFSWEDTVPFDERVRIATGRSSAGNPFAFPANALFAIRHRVPLGRYDRAVGPYLLDERLPTTNPLWPQKRSQTVVLSEPWAIAFFGRDFRQTDQGAELVADEGEIFVPLNRPGRIEIALACDGSPDALSFDGTPVEGLRFAVPNVERGINLLRLRSAKPLRIQTLTVFEGPDWPPAWAREAVPLPK